MSHIEALEEVIKLQKEKIEALEKENTELKISKTQFTPFIGGGSLRIPPNGFVTVQNCAHEYPEMWGGIAPPNCRKCGQASTNWYTITCATQQQQQIAQQAYNQNQGLQVLRNEG